MNTTKKQLCDIVSKNNITVVIGQYDGRPNTLYITNEPIDLPIPVSLNGNISSTINVELTENMPEVYNDLILHITTYGRMDIDMKPDNSSTTEEDIVQINVNDTACIAYYIPRTNSFIMGDLLWHHHYVSIVMKNIWPQIVEKLKIS